MIELINVGKKYKDGRTDRWALRKVSFSIEDGEFVSIIGKSGSGKTTILNCIGMLDSFSCGEYFVDDCQISKVKNFEKIRKEKMSFVFQNYELLNKYTVYENLEIPILCKKNKNKKIIDNYLEQFGITYLRNSFPVHLSRGEQQKVAIIRALIMDTPYIIADEPTAALDEKNRDIIMNIMKEIHREGKTIIFATHDMALAKQTDRVIDLSVDLRGDLYED